MDNFDYKNKKWMTPRSTRYGGLFVENTHLGFVEGKEFRAFHDFSLANNGVSVLKFYAPIQFILHEQGFSLIEGELKFEALLGGTEGGSFSTAVPIFGKNRSSERPEPYYERQIVLTTGGTHTGGTNSETVRLKAANNSNFASTVGGVSTNIRFLPAGTYYLKFTATGATRGVYSITWEERP